MNANKEAQSSNITKFQIFSNRANGKTADVSAGVIMFDYYESILENTIKFCVTITDTGNALDSDDGTGSNVNVLHGLKLSGFEKVHLEFNDNYDNKLVFNDQNPLYISKVRNIYSHSEKTIFTIDLVTKEFLINEFLASEVYQRYDGEISTSVTKILKDYLKTNKDIEADPTSNKYNFFGSGKKPFRLCTELGKYCVPAGVKSSAGYFFFENYDGYKFKSIDKLFDTSRGYKSYIYNLTTLLPPGYDGKILKYNADKIIDVQKNLVMGFYGSRLESFNPYNDKFDTQSKQLLSNEQEELGGYELPKLGSEFEQFGGYSRRSYKRLDVGQAPSGSSEEQARKNQEENLKVNDVTIQSFMRYNKVFNLVLTIFVSGDLSLRAGDLIHCDFPEQSSKKTQDVDKELSGIYMISDICYHATPDRTITKMNLIRDSYGRKSKKV